MKSMKKIAALILALIMVFALSATAFASSGEGDPGSEATPTFTIKLSGTAASPTAGHTYEVYQIFTGKLAEINGDKVLSDVAYGANYTPGDTAVGDDVPEDVLKSITDAAAFADSLIEGNLLEGEPFAVLNEANDWTLEEVPAGYYLILDTTDPLPELHTRSAYIVQVVGDVNMAPKAGVVTVEKKVQDVNDSEDSSIDDNDWQDSADHDIGDHIPYRITSSISNIADFDDYKVIFTDVMSKGLTYDDNMVITMTYTYTYTENGETKSALVEDADVTAHFTVESAPCTDTEGPYVEGTVLTVTCEDLKAIVDNGNLVDAVITINYTATLNENALTGDPGNPNKVHLEYDRSPTETGITPDDVNIVFTFKTTVNKVDPDLQPLTGAEFALAKFILDEEGEETHHGLTGYWKTLELIKNEEGTVFSFTGLDDGFYRITETLAPVGYNAIDPIYFTVTAEHDVLADDPKLTKLEGTQTEADKALGSIATFEVVAEDGISTDIVNKAGTILPETGGIGTTIFYIVGAVLVLAAIVLLVTRRRMSAK